jgi:hypothetical protein
MRVPVSSPYRTPVFPIATSRIADRLPADERQAKLPAEAPVTTAAPGQAIGAPLLAFPLAVELLPATAVYRGAALATLLRCRR